MALARFFMPLAGWRSGVVSDFLALSDVTEQLAFWRVHLDTRRFRTGFDALLSAAILRLVYAPQFLSFLPARFGTVLKEDGCERGFARHANATNHYVRALFLGEPPAQLQPDTSRIQFVLGDAASYLESCAAESFEAFTLSNILDGADASYREWLARAVRHAATKDAVVVLRSFAEPTPDITTNYAERDRAMVWGAVDIRSASSF